MVRPSYLLNGLETWRLSWVHRLQSLHFPDDDGKFLPVSKEPDKLAQVKCKSGSRILCSAIDDDGQVVAYSDGRKTNLYLIKVVSDLSDCPLSGRYSAFLFRNQAKTVKTIPQWLSSRSNVSTRRFLAPAHLHLPRRRQCSWPTKTELCSGSRSTMSSVDWSL